MLLVSVLFALRARTYQGEPGVDLEKGVCLDEIPAWSLGRGRLLSGSLRRGTRRADSVGLEGSGESKGSRLSGASIQVPRSQDSGFLGVPLFPCQSTNFSYTPSLCSSASFTSKSWPCLVAQSALWVQEMRISLKTALDACWLSQHAVCVHLAYLNLLFFL